MIAAIFAYSMLVASLAGVAALSAERCLAELRLPRRFAWLGAYGTAVLLPLSSLLLAAAPPPAATVAPGFARAATVAADARVEWDATLMTLWVAASAVMMLLFLVSWLRLLFLAKRWPRVASDTGTVVVADQMGPAVLGIVRPRVVFPRWLVDAPAPVRRLVMAHEEQHVAARDPALLAAAQLVTIALPWNLPLWWFARRLRMAIEIDCDARVLCTGVDPAQYGEVLLAIGERRTSVPSIAAALTEPVTQLERRIRVMLTRPNRAPKRRATLAFASTLVLAACTAQLEAPPLPPSSTPAAESVRPITTVEPDDIEISAQTLEIEGDVTTMRNALLSLRGMGNTTATSDRIVKTADGILLEGNVRLVIDKVYVTTPRAVFTTTPDGRALVQMDDATLTHTQ